MKTAKKTMIIGASPDPTRYAYKAAQMLTGRNYPIVNIGIKKGQVAGETIQSASLEDMPEDIHTITLYVGPANQPEYYDYILKTNPKRVIFNPGTENSELELLLKENGIEAVVACTLVMLVTGQY